MSKKNAGYRVGSRPVPDWITALVSSGAAHLLNAGLPSEQVVVLSACARNRIYKRGDIVPQPGHVREAILEEGALVEECAEVVEGIGGGEAVD